MRCKQTKPSKTCPCREVSQGCNSTVKKLTSSAKSSGWRNKPDSKPSDSEMPADVSVKQLNKGLAGCWIKAKVMLAAMKMKRQRHNQRYKSNLHNQQLRLQRRCEQSRRARLGRENLFTNSHLCCWKNPFGPRQNIGSMSHYSNTECMNSSFKLHFMLSVLSQSINQYLYLNTIMFKACSLWDRV